jgi:hypothetical protein
MGRPRRPRYYAGLLVLEKDLPHYSMMERMMKEYQPINNEIEWVKPSNQEPFPYELLIIETKHHSPQKYFSSWHVYDCAIVGQSDKSYKLQVRMGWNSSAQSLLVGVMWVRKSSPFHLIKKKVNRQGGK